ncbi:MAG: hypothetical protein Q9217_000539 [Psora testacea]
MIEEDVQSSSSAQSENSNSGSESDEGDPVESLVVGRAKRATAGNRLSALVDKEQDDELELLFAENEHEEDESFDEDEDDASDANLGGSSSDEEDREQTKDADDLAGEKELQSQARLEKKKRKAKDMAKMPGMARKKVKIDPTAILTTAAPPPRPKKKSERVSWVATAADAPTRISSRKQTVQNREVVHQRLVNSEKQRIKVMRQMEEAQKRKDAMKPKALTQAQRMEEATKTERRNAKSLNRWEESEKKRAAEQKAKLEALHNRQLSGPVISWWSGIARWVNGKIGQLGVKEIRKAGHHEESVKVSKDSKFSDLVDDARRNRGNDRNVTQRSPYSNNQHNPYTQPVQFAAPQGPYSFLDGIHAYAALPIQQQRAEFTGTADGALLPLGPAPSAKQVQTHQAPVRIEPVIDYTSRNMVALKNVDANAERLPEIQNSVLVRKRGSKPPSECDKCIRRYECITDQATEPFPEHCAITGQLAKFRDPKTGLTYANPYAYKEIQRLASGGFRWSNLLECYVGPTSSVARGVPERFWKRP